MSRPYAELIGDPVAHSKSPLIHNFWLVKLGIEAEYRRCRVRPDELADYFMRRRGDPDWRGCNVTMPHKQSVERFVDQVETTVGWAGDAVNTIYWDLGGLWAHNTDLQGVGMAMTAQNENGRSPAEEGIAVLIGAGGAARAAMAHLAGEPCREARIIARDQVAAQRLLTDYRLTGSVHGFDDAAHALAGADCVMNATPLGMQGQPPMPKAVLDGLCCTKPNALVFDMVYAPTRTELLRAAQSADLPTVDGLVMLMEQAREAFWSFFVDLLPEPAHPEELCPTRTWDAELRALLIA